MMPTITQSTVETRTHDELCAQLEISQIEMIHTDLQESLSSWTKL
jgi:hypothetical protein